MHPTRAGQARLATTRLHLAQLLLPILFMLDVDCYKPRYFINAWLQSNIVSRKASFAPFKGTTQRVARVATVVRAAENNGVAPSSGSDGAPTLTFKQVGSQPPPLATMLKFCQESGFTG